MDPVLNRRIHQNLVRTKRTRYYDLRPSQAGLEPDFAPIRVNFGTVRRVCQTQRTPPATLEPNRMKSRLQAPILSLRREALSLHSSNEVHALGFSAAR